MFCSKLVLPEYVQQSVKKAQDLRVQCFNYKQKCQIGWIRCSMPNMRRNYAFTYEQYVKVDWRGLTNQKSSLDHFHARHEYVTQFFLLSFLNFSFFWYICSILIFSVSYLLMLFRRIWWNIILRYCRVAALYRYIQFNCAVIDFHGQSGQNRPKPAKTVNMTSFVRFEWIDIEIRS